MYRIGVLHSPPFNAIASSRIKELLGGYTNYTGRGVTIAVLDSGVNDTHPALSGKVAVKKDFTGGNDPDDYYGHGTHIASIIAGSPINSNYGVIEGMAPAARILSLKVFDDRGHGKPEWIVNGLKEALRLNADLVNISGGGFGAGRERDAIRDLVNKNIMVVAAAGNEGLGNINFPAGFNEAIAVGTMENGVRAGFSSTGSAKPDIMAPGIDIVSGCKGAIDGLYDGLKDGVEPMSGTSVSTPYVTGALAQVIEAAKRRLNRAEIEKVLSAAGDLKKNAYSGYGLLNVGRAIESLQYLDSINIQPSSRGLLPAIGLMGLGGLLVWKLGR